MITELYTFSPGSYVVAEEWNANFRTINTVNVLHAEAIVDAQNEIAFPNSDLSQVFAAVRKQDNSHILSANTDSVLVHPEQEYCKVLSVGEFLTIDVPTGLNSEVRVLLQTPDNRNDIDNIFKINYTGTKIINHYNNNVFRAGFYYVMIYETNGVVQAKLIWTGV